MSTMTTSTAALLLDGEWIDRDKHLDVHDPADGSLVGSVAWGGPAEATAAADAAARAFGGWSAGTARSRAEVLLAGAQLISDRARAIAELLAREAGKRLPEAQGELAFSAEYFRWFAEETRRPDGANLPPESTTVRHLTRRRPLGVVASLTPWNFPCSIQARKLAPALAAGCTVVARVSEKAPLAVTELIRCLTDAGLPPGVLNLVHGPARQVTQSLLRHPAVRAVTFTGSTRVGREIMAAAAERIVRPLLELGGDAPFIVCDDADVDAAVEGALIAKFRNTGQSCIGANRFFVQDGVYERFVGALVAKVDAMSIGSGLADPMPDLGPVIDADRVTAVTAMVEEALAGGGTRLTRQRELPADGNWIAPTLIADVPDGAALATQEVFGPAAGVFRFTDEAELVARANNTEMGLAGYVYSRDISRAWRIAEQLETGIVGVNHALPSVAFAPMGGMKQSGLGREGGAAGLEEFTETQYLALGI